MLVEQELDERELRFRIGRLAGTGAHRRGDRATCVIPRTSAPARAARAFVRRGDQLGAAALTASSWARSAAFSATTSSYAGSSAAGRDTGATWPTASEYFR